MGTPTNLPLGVTAHWFGLPVSDIVSTTASVDVSITLRLFSDSIVVKSLLPSAWTHAPWTCSPTLMALTTFNVVRSITVISSPRLLVTYNFITSLPGEQTPIDAHAVSTPSHVVKQRTPTRIVYLRPPPFDGSFLSASVTHTVLPRNGPFQKQPTKDPGVGVPVRALTAAAFDLTEGKST
jgi:hypothetical protein